MGSRREERGRRLHCNPDEGMTDLERPGYGFKDEGRKSPLTDQ